MLSWSASASGLAPGVHLLARVQERTCRKHDRFTARNAFADRHAVVVAGADLDRATLDLLLAVDDVDIIALVVAKHRALRKDRGGRRSRSDSRLGKAAGAHRVAVGHGDAHIAEPRLRIDHRRHLPDIAD